MKTALKIVLFLLIIGFSLFAIVFFRDVPAVKIWENYRIFYVDKDLNLFDVLNDGEKSGIISKNTQNYPTQNAFTPIMLDYSIKNFSSTELRDVFFHDMENKYQLFYVEEDFVPDVENALREKDVSFGTDAKANIPIICPIVCLLLLILLTIFSKSKIKFFIAKLPFVILAYSVPYYSVAISVCCFITCLFFLEIYILREDWLKSILKKPLLLCFFGFCLVMFGLCGIRAFLLFVLAFIAWGCVLVFASFFNQKLIYGFSMKQILPLKYVKTKKLTNLKFTGIAFLAVLVLFIILCFSSNFKTNLKENNLFLPSPSEYTDLESFTKLEENYSFVKSFEQENQETDFLPNIFDFVDESWIISTFPYERLGFSDVYHNLVEIGKKVSIPEYKKTSNGLVISEEKVLFTFDENYLSDSLESFQTSTGIEKLLLSQKPYSNIVYSSGGKVENTILMWIVGCCGLIIMGLFTLFCVVKRQKL
ncbi:MAG: hypothetical protein J6A14_03305 [Spirochaetaceae bacterium]|nr:hypothetical protein [Spirochaetaceae bacterium]